MFHQNIGTQVRSSTKYLGVVALIIFVLGAGYGVYQQMKSKQPKVSEKTSSQQPQVQRQEHDCTSQKPCVSVIKTDGSTEKVNIPTGKSICFEASSWDNRPKLGYTTSYKGGNPVKHTCTRRQVDAGTCSEERSDTFWFVPEPGISIPKHWFVQEGAKQC